MERSKTQFSRLMQLDQCLRNKEYPNCLTFSADYEVSQKTIQRDIDFLRDQLGAPIAYDRDRKGFYYTDMNWFLPSLSLSEGDLLALLVGTRALEAYRGTPVANDLQKVYSKLSAMLPNKLSFRPELLFTRFTFTSPPAKPIEEKTWIALVRGLMNQRSIKIAYRSMEAKEATERVIDPYHIANLAGEWYVFAWCHRAGQVIQFSVSRIQKTHLMEQTFKIPDDFDPDKLLATTFGRFAMGEKAHDVRLLFNREIATWVLERQWQPRQRVHTRADGDVELSFKASGLFEVFRWVMGWGHWVKVLAPEELQKQIADEVRLMSLEQEGKSPRRQE